jgi:hypothetical protein
MPTKASSATPAAGELSLSIVIPVFNEQSILMANAEALANYLDNMLGSDNWLYIFVDNGSTDGTPALPELQTLAPDVPQRPAQPDGIV